MLLSFVFPSQYPASGLLLRDEYRTFAEIEKEGERVYEPLDPLIRLLKNFGIPDNNSGADGVVKKQFHETLVMRATIPAHSTSWAINICPKDHKDFEEILFHFNPRRRFVAMNNREGNIWGQQVLCYCSFVYGVGTSPFLLPSRCARTTMLQQTRRWFMRLVRCRTRAGDPSPFSA